MQRFTFLVRDVNGEMEQWYCTGNAMIRLYMEGDRESIPMVFDTSVVVLIL